MNAQELLNSPELWDYQEGDADMQISNVCARDKTDAIALAVMQEVFG